MGTELRRLHIDDNILTGTIPSELGLLTSLRSISLSNNFDITGTIPSELGLLTELTFLNIRNLQLDYTILSELQQLIDSGNLVLLDDSNNDDNTSAPTTGGVGLTSAAPVGFTSSPVGFTSAPTTENAGFTS